jgi:hypothetical protein
MEKDNKKARDSARKEYNETVKVRLAGARFTTVRTLMTERQ